MAPTSSTRTAAPAMTNRYGDSFSIQGDISVCIDPTPGAPPFILCIRRPRRARYVVLRFTFRTRNCRCSLRAQRARGRVGRLAYGVQLGAAGRHTRGMVPTAAGHGLAYGEPAAGLRARAARPRTPDSARTRHDPVQRRRGPDRPDDRAVPVDDRSRGHQGSGAELPVRPREPGQAALA